MILAILFGLLGSPLSAPQSAVGFNAVYPTGKFPDDVVAVRAALANSPNVLLKATDEKGRPTTFNFGMGPKDGGQLRITKDLTLSGETVHGKQTTIRGGILPVWVREPVRVKVSGICFDSPFTGAILLGKTSGAEIVENVIRNVRTLPSFEKSPQVAIGAVSSDIKGHVLISGNTIDGMDAMFSYGIQTVATDAELEISHNTIRGVQLNSILCGYPVRDVLIYQNHIIPGPGKNKESVGNGILVGHTKGGHYHIIENIVKCENPNADGIVLVGNDKNPTLNSDVTGNEITMSASVSSAIGLYGLVSHCSIYGNHISGSAAYAFQIVSQPPNDGGDAVGNLFLNNRLSSFSAVAATIYLSSSSQATIFRGGGSDYIDEGKDDSILGLKKSKNKPAPAP